MHLLFCQPQYLLSEKFEVSWLSKYIHGQLKIGCNTPRVKQLVWLCFCPKMASEAISEHLISKNFLGEHAPRPPQSCMLMQITDPCNPPSKIPGYTPATSLLRISVARLHTKLVNLLQQLYSTFNATQAEICLMPSVSQGFKLRRTMDQWLMKLHLRTNLQHLEPTYYWKVHDDSWKCSSEEHQLHTS